MGEEGRAREVSEAPREYFPAGYGGRFCPDERALSFASMREKRYLGISGSAESGKQSTVAGPLTEDLRLLSCKIDHR